MQPIEIETAPAPQHAVIWLHGLGADGNDFVPLVGHFTLPAATRFVFPHAPMRAITINGGMQMRGWYDLTGMEFTKDEDRDGIVQSASMVDELIAHENARGIATQNIVIAGFSQGGAVALHAGLRHRQRLAGIIALSTYLPLADALPAEKSEANQSTPIFMAHGAVDPVIPIALARGSRRHLLQGGHSVEWHEYAMPHSVCAEEVADINAFLANRLCASTP